MFDPPVFRQNYPSALAYFREPFLVLRIGGKMIVVNFNLISRFAECFGNNLLTK